MPDPAGLISAELHFLSISIIQNPIGIGLIHLGRRPAGKP